MKYWAYLNGEVPDSFTADELAALPGFSTATLVCPARTDSAEKDWRRAGEFADIAAAVAARGSAAAAPLAGATTAAPGPDVNAQIDATSAKLFSHVAALMMELETQREHKILIPSLQRQVALLKDELERARARADLVEPRLAELEESSRRDRAALESAQSGARAREKEFDESRNAAEKLKAECEAMNHRLQEAADHLAARDQLSGKLAKELSEKDVSLAKSLGVIRRLEEDLNRLVRHRPALPADPAITTPKEAPRLDEEPLEASEEEERPKALSRFLNRIFPDQEG